MERMMGELQDCDKIRQDLVTLRLLLSDQTNQFSKNTGVYQDSLAILRKEIVKLSGLTEDLNDSLHIQSGQLKYLDKKYDKVRRSRRIWTVIGIGTLAAIVGVHYHWKYGPNLND
jgi:chromosome segregation ATPase